MSREIWSMFFSSVVSIQGHPGNKNPKSTEQCAKEADFMYAQFAKREKEDAWLR